MIMKTTREDHLAWCKQRALVYVDANDAKNAFASMASDLSKHPETEGHKALELGMSLLLGRHLDSPIKMRDFINGFN